MPGEYIKITGEDYEIKKYYSLSINENQQDQLQESSSKGQRVLL